MSKIGKKPINIPQEVEIKIHGNVLEFKGKNGSLRVEILPFIKAELKDNTLSFDVVNDSRQAKANWGTTRALAQNAIIGVKDGFSKILEIEGVGYKVSAEGNNLTFNIGFSHPVKFIPPEGIKISVEKNIIKVSGIDKALVGKTAAEIRSLKKPEPYKGKGIKYRGEIIRRKEGKKAAATAK
ncbi:MAG: 50S ribosomal protein L6 [Candidatus Wolfebacteria bacterium GW2011_GWA2_42_10]|uniref:Large ribosomal subunit protein uL6 n=2 Tax=Candidatus Wolfeibacteriota TaxID=1752735 RepID=A0A0G0XL57_9BACT|nr:MAG: 50S ribosomal protein L6 [Candidatus Wolfebacteria bacterium GW2011_GWB1_41_12]KKS25625.1 MAG: 50S ribosomal protein L6 [Candidatus Wolfebacteria bacterium GW2011_GWA2_42_10]KKT56485.1 MAG: 50S ribosomal protein L6 [Candidatus Wolfebacteria bacterium GW2011_GWA1_44_24]